MELKENRLFCRKSGRDSIVPRGLWISEMAKLFYFIAFIIIATHAQENALRNLPPSLRECYENKYLLQRDNRLPHTLNSLIAIIRKIENLEGLNMDLRSLSVALLHRFRQDGIVPNPSVPIQDGVTPYAPNAYQFFRHAQTLRFIPGNAVAFPNNSITDIERCTLHFMFSSSIEIFQRGDEAKVCRYANAAYRNQRSIADKDNDRSNPESTINDVETLSPHEIDIITKRKDADAPGTIDPNSLYPDLPPNHPDSARMFQLPPQTKCPVENGVIKTPWGPVSAGVLLAGIAAGSQPETITLQDLQTDTVQKDKYPTGLTLDNKWMATLAGDLAEVALRQGPRGETLSVGATGNWNSTALPRWYFLNSNEKLEFTTAEIRGDLDALILANEVNTWYSKIPSLRLSQILDMYYSARGFFDPAIKACNRRTLFTSVAPNSTMSPQAYSAALVLDPDLTKATLDFAAIEKFTVQAVKELTTYIPSQLNKDLPCLETDRLFDFNQISVDLTILLDTRWLFTEIQPVLAHLLDNIDINQYNSNFTLINGHDGTPIINSTNNILDFFYFNSSHYANVSHGFDLPKSLEKLSSILTDKLNNERVRGIGGGRSDVVLIIPHTSSIDKTDKEYCLQNIRRMREQMPDTTMLILTYGSKDTWSDLVLNSATDLFSVNIGDTPEALSSLTPVISRMKQVPKRLINTQCGADYVSIGSSNQYVDYIEPRGINFYRLHPNYFYSNGGSNTATIKIQSSGSNGLTVCTSRELLHVNTTQNMTSASCNSITNNVHSITVSCPDSNLIHECPPLFLSVNANSSTTSYQCTDYRVCRFATLIKYTISYENLVCTSGSSGIMFTPIILVLILTYLHL